MILLLDEPLTGIDLAAAQAIDAVIHDESERGCTVVMTTHDLSEAQVANHVLLLAGRVVASGPPDEVLTRENLVAAYGQSLLHVDDGGQLFLDDPCAHPSSGSPCAQGTHHPHRVISRGIARSRALTGWGDSIGHANTIGATPRPEE